MNTYPIRELMNDSSKAVLDALCEAFGVEPRR